MTAELSRITFVCLCVAGLCSCQGNFDPCTGVECSGHGVCLDNDRVAICVCEDDFVASGLECLPEGSDGDGDVDSDSDVDGDVDSDSDVDGDVDGDSDVDGDGDTDSDADADDGGGGPLLGDVIQIGPGAMPIAMDFGDAGVLIAGFDESGLPDDEGGRIRFYGLSWEADDMEFLLEHAALGETSTAELEGHGRAFSTCTADPDEPWALIWVGIDPNDEELLYRSVLLAVSWSRRGSWFEVVDLTEDVFGGLDPHPSGGAVVGDTTGCTVVWTESDSPVHRVRARRVEFPATAGVAHNTVEVMDGAGVDDVIWELDCFSGDAEETSKVMAAADGGGGALVMAPVYRVSDGSAVLLGQHIDVEGTRRLSGGTLGGKEFFDAAEANTSTGSDIERIMFINGPSPVRITRGVASFAVTAMTIDQDPRVCLYAGYMDVASGTANPPVHPVHPCLPGLAYPTMAWLETEDPMASFVSFWEWSGGMMPPLNAHFLKVAEPPVGTTIDDAILPVLHRHTDDYLMARWIRGDPNQGFSIFLTLFDADLEIVPGWPFPSQGLVIHDGSPQYSLGAELGTIPSPLSGPDGEIIQVYEVASEGFPSIHARRIAPGI